MRYRSFFRFLTLILFILLLFGCAEEGATKDETQDSDSEQENGEETEQSDEQQGGELRIVYSAQPPFLNPHESTAIAITDIMRQVFKPLLTVDSE